MKYFVLASDGELYNCCDCGDEEAAEESALDVIPEGCGIIWIINEDTARRWLDALDRWVDP